MGGIDLKNYLVWNVTNVGRQSVLLTHIGGVNRNKTAFLIPNPRTPLPKMLQPGEYVLEYIEDLSVLGNNLVALTASDSCGRTFKAPRKQIKKLKREYASGNLANHSN